MKTIKICIGFIFCLLLISQVFTASAVPPLPSSFYGKVKTNGENVPLGSIVRARINGVYYAQAPVALFNGDTVFSLDVPGNDPTTSEIEGGLPGDSVSFIISGQVAHESGTWSSGTNVNLDLNFPTIPSVPQMPSSFYGTVKIGGENVPDDAVIEATINGIAYASTIVQMDNGNTVYAINVPADDPDTPGIEGGVHGDTIVFLVGGEPAHETGTWVSESNVELNLTLDEKDGPYRYYFPLILR